MDVKGLTNLPFRIKFCHQTQGRGGQARPSRSTGVAFSAARSSPVASLVLHRVSAGEGCRLASVISVTHGLVLSQITHVAGPVVLQRVVQQLITSIFSLLLLAQEILVGMDIGDCLSCGGRTSV